MGLFEKIFTKNEQTRQAETFFRELNGYQPSFHSWNGKLYESELVRASIDCKARHASKLKFEIRGSAKKEMQSALKRQPNSYQTWGQFIYRLSTILDMQGTAFIVPTWDKMNNIKGLNTFCPREWSLVQVKDDSEPWIRFVFDSRKTASARLSEIGIMTKYQYESDFFGTKNNALKDTMELINIQNQGINEAIKNSSSYRFMAKLTNFTKAEDLQKERERFSEEVMAKKGSFILFPNTYGDIKQIDSKPYTVDAGQRQLIQDNVFNYFGVNLEVLQNKATSEQMDAFFNGAIEPFEIQLSDVLTRVLFTERERELGNRCDVSANRLMYMTVSSKISMAKELGDRGFITVNEVRELFNFPTLPPEIGDKMPIRGEFYFNNETEEKTE